MSTALFAAMLVVLLAHSIGADSCHGAFVKPAVLNMRLRGGSGLVKCAKSKFVVCQILSILPETSRWFALHADGSWVKWIRKLAQWSRRKSLRRRRKRKRSLQRQRQSSRRKQEASQGSTLQINEANQRT